MSLFKPYFTKFGIYDNLINLLHKKSTDNCLSTRTQFINKGSYSIVSKIRLKSLYNLFMVKNHKNILKINFST